MAPHKTVAASVKGTTPLRCGAVALVRDRFVCVVGVVGRVGSGGGCGCCPSCCCRWVKVWTIRAKPDGPAIITPPQRRRTPDQIVRWSARIVKPAETAQQHPIIVHTKFVHPRLERHRIGDEMRCGGIQRIDRGCGDSPLRPDDHALLPSWWTTRNHNSSYSSFSYHASFSFAVVHARHNIDGYSRQ